MAVGLQAARVATLDTLSCAALAHLRRSCWHRAASWMSRTAVLPGLWQQPLPAEPSAPWAACEPADKDQIPC